MLALIPLALLGPRAPTTNQSFTAHFARLAHLIQPGQSFKVENSYSGDAGVDYGARVGSTRFDYYKVNYACGI